MEKVLFDTYLGDIISSDGKNTRNVDSRVSKALGIIASIFDVLKHVLFGRHYFTIAFLMRNVMLINGILTNSEVWFGLTLGEIRKLEEVDKIFMRRLFRVAKTCPTEAFYLESGCIPISYAIKARRLNYLHHLVTRNESEMLFKVFKAQWDRPVKNDWTEQVKDDRKSLGFETDLDWVKQIKKDKFKEIIKDKIHEKAFKDLMDRKIKHSKLKNLEYKNLEMQQYLSHGDISVNQARIIFKYRTRMSNYWNNFRGSLEDQNCPVCKKENTSDTQEHGLECEVLMKSLHVNVKVSEIFQAVTPEIGKMLEKIEQFREIYLKWN